MNFSKKLFIISVSTALVTLSSCNNVDEEKQNDTFNSEFLETSVKKPKPSFNNAFDGKLYSVSSGFQSENLFNSSTVPFDSSLLYVRKNAGLFPNYTSQALHLGFYYADILYINSCNQNKIFSPYLKPMQSLVNNLELSAIITPSFSTRINSNIDNNDSLLYIMNNQFSKLDYYLKENDKKNISALILTGTWLKSIYNTTQLYEKRHNNQFVQYICQQKQNFETILAMIEKYNISGQNDQYITDFQNLNELFHTIEIVNEYNAPETDDENKKTVIKNQVKIKAEEETIVQIKEQIANIYSKIITS